MLALIDHRRAQLAFRRAAGQLIGMSLGIFLGFTAGFVGGRTDDVIRVSPT